MAKSSPGEAQEEQMLQMLQMTDLQLSEQKLSITASSSGKFTALVWSLCKVLLLGVAKSAPCPAVWISCPSNQRRTVNTESLWLLVVYLPQGAWPARSQLFGTNVRVCVSVVSLVPSHDSQPIPITWDLLSSPNNDSDNKGNFRMQVSSMTQELLHLPTAKYCERSQENDHAHKHHHSQEQ